MRHFARVSAVVLTAVVISGCGSASNLGAEGAPAGVDRTKSYTPSADLPKMSPKDMQKARSGGMLGSTPAPAKK